VNMVHALVKNQNTLIEKSVILIWHRVTKEAVYGKYQIKAHSNPYCEVKTFHYTHDKVQSPASSIPQLSTPIIPTLYIMQHLK